MNYKVIAYKVISLLGLLTVSVEFCAGQKEGGSTYTHAFIAKIESIDTTGLTDDRFRKSLGVTYHDTVIKVNLKILKPIKGNTDKIADFIVMDLDVSDHTCQYYFEQGKEYRIYCNKTRYVERALKKISFQQYFFKLDCWKMPEKISLIKKKNDGETSQPY